VNYGPRIVRSGLTLALDAADRNSYIGSGTSWKDISGNNYISTLSASIIFVPSNAGAIYFDGSSAYASISNTSNFNFTNSSGTISIWFRTNALPSSGSYLISKNMDSTGGWGITMGSDGIPYFEAKNNASGATAFYRFANQVCADGNWHNIVAVFTTSTTVVANNTVSIYIDGKLSNGALTQILVYGGNTSGNIELARRSSGNYYSGYICNALIYNRALTADEILYNYNNTILRYQASGYDWFSPYVLTYIRGNGTNGDTLIPNLVVGGADLNSSGIGSITNAQSKWGGTSFRIDSGGNGLSFPSISSLGTGNFTMEFWYYTSALRSDIRFIGGGGANALGFGSRVVGSRYIGFVREGVAWYGEALWSPFPILNQWVHIAACKIGTDIKYFQNGVQLGSTIAMTQSLAQSTAPYLAGVNGVGSPTYYNDVRITSIGLYSSAFTPPTAQFNSYR